jgi:hypothetical protein
MIAKAGPATKKTDAIGIARENLKMQIRRTLVGFKGQPPSPDELDRITVAIEALVVAIITKE